MGDQPITMAELMRAQLITHNVERLHGLRAFYQGRPIMVLVVEDDMSDLPGYKQSIPVAILLDETFEGELELPEGVTRHDPETN